MVKSISSLPGKPLAFSSVSQALQVSENSSSGPEKPELSLENGGGESLQLNLEEKVRMHEQQELSRKGKELIALRMIPDSVKLQGLSPETGNTVVNNESGMKAVVIAREEGSKSQFSVKILQVTENGDTREVFQSGSLSLLQANSRSNQKMNLNLQGSLLEKSV